MLTVEEAQAKVMAEIVPGEAESVPLNDAHGRVLREDLVASFDAPEADNSAMDGYAVRAEDIAGPPVTLRVLGDIAAGHLAERAVEAGTALRIMTGAYV